MRKKERDQTTQTPKRQRLSFLLCLLGCVIFSWFGSGCRSQVRYERGGAQRNLGQFRLSVYWLSHERYFRGPRNTPLLSGGRRIARVSERFARSLRMQGSGRLRDGRLVQYAGRCRRRRRFCLRVRQINRRRYPSGVGAAQVALRPFRSVAVDTRWIALGTPLYIPTLGRLLRRAGRTHDGCFVAHDRGGRIRKARLDLFTGNRRLYRRHLKGRMPRYARVYVGRRRCQRLGFRP